MLLLLGHVADSHDACGTDDDAVAQLQLDWRPVTPPPPPPSCNTSETSLLASFIAEKAYLKIESGMGKTARGTLTLSGSSVNMVRTFSDRPFRYSSSMDASKFVNMFMSNFDEKSGGFPNAVIAGGTPDGVRQATIVLKSASYHTNKVTFDWSSDDDSMVQSLEFVSASLFIDGGFFCILSNAAGVAKNKLCNVIGTMVVNSPGLACATIDLEGAGICAGISAESGEILLPFCTAAVVALCQVIVSQITDTVISAINGGKLSVDDECSKLGYSNPCP